MKGCDDVPNVRREKKVLAEENNEASLMRHLRIEEKRGGRSSPRGGRRPSESGASSRPLAQCEAGD
jgi:hypothetical protein